MPGGSLSCGLRGGALYRLCARDSVKAGDLFLATITMEPPTAGSAASCNPKKPLTKVSLHREDPPSHRLSRSSGMLQMPGHPSTFAHLNITIGLLIVLRSRFRRSCWSFVFTHTVERVRVWIGHEAQPPTHTSWTRRLIWLSSLSHPS